MKHKLLQILLLTVYCLLPTAVFAAISTVDSSGGAYSSVKLQSNDNPAIAYFDYKTGELRYSFWTGSQWIRTVVEEKGVTGYVSLMLDSSNKPYISYYHNISKNNSTGTDISGKYGNHMVGTLKYAYCSTTTCLTPEDWTKVTVAQIDSAVTSNGYTGGFTSLAFDSSGNPRIAYYDYSHKIDANDIKKGALKLAYCNSNCGISSNWSTSTIDTDGGKSASMVIDGSNKVMLSYDADEVQKVRYAESSPPFSLWNKVDIDAVVNTSNLYRDTSIAIDPTTGKPRLVYQYQGEFDYGTSTNTGEISPGVSGSSTGSGQGGGARRYKSNNDQPGKITRRDAYYAYCDASDCGTNPLSWTKVIVASAENNLRGYTSSIKVGSNGIPKIAYHYWGYRATTYYYNIVLAQDLHYVLCGNSACSSGNTISTLDSTENTGLYSSMALDSGGNPFISYYNYDSNQLKLYHPTNSYTDTGITADVRASDTSNGGSGLQDGDSFTILFSGATNGSACSITTANIDSILKLSNGHKWTCSGSSVDVQWSSTYYANDTLKITVHPGTGGCMPTVEVGDRVSLNGSCILDGNGNPIILQTEIKGSTGVKAPTGAVAYYKMNEGAKLTAYDSVGPHHASLNNGVAWTTGLSGYGLSFDGSDDYLIVPGDPVDLDINGKRITMEAWIKPNTNTFDTVHTVLAKENSYVMASNGQCAINTSGTAWTWYGDTLGMMKPQQGIWKQVVCTYDSSTGLQKVYIDGIFSGQRAATGNVSPSNYPFVMGRREQSIINQGTSAGRSAVYYGANYTGNNSWGVNYYNGKMDEVVIYNTALSQTDILNRISQLPAQFERADANDTSGLGYGLQAGDTIKIKFTNETNAPVITKNNINIVLIPTTGKTWLDGSGNIGGAAWSQTRFPNDTLTITLNTTTSLPTIATGNTITLDGVAIKDKFGNPITGSTTIKGSYDLNGAVAYWGFESNTTDTVGQYNDGTLVNTPTYAAGKFGNAISLNGSSQYVSVLNYTDLNPSNITVEAWVNLSATGTGDRAIVSKENEYRLMYSSATNKFAFYLGNGTSWPYQGVFSTTLPSPNTWYHVVGTWDGTNQKIYVNGVQEGSIGIPVTFGSNTNIVEIGGWGAGYSLNGSIDEVVIYNRAITADEAMKRSSSRLKYAVAKDASNGGVGIQSGDKVIITFDAPTAAASITSANIAAALSLSSSHVWGTIQSAIWSTTTYANDTLTITLSTTGSPTVAVGDTITLGTTLLDTFNRALTGSIVIGGNFGVNLPPNSIAYYNFDEQGGTTAHDSIGNNHGALNNSFWRTERTFKGVYFDGSRYITVPDSNDFNLSSYTLDTWVKVPDGLTAGIRRIISQDDGTNYWKLQLNNNNLELCDSRLSTPCNSVNPAVPINDGEWHHLIAIRDDTNNQVLLYVDGVATTFSGVTGTGTHNIAASVQIGRKYDGTEYFYGMIDEIAVYNRVLTYAEVKSRYRSPVKSAFTIDPYFNSGIQSGDKVIIRFHGKTNGYAITGGNIGTVLSLSSGSWGTVQSAVWSTYKWTNDTLTVTLGTGATIASGATITVNGTYIKDIFNNAISDSFVLSKDFDFNLPEGAVAYWKLENNNDSFAQNNVVTNTGTAGACKFGNCYTYGASQYASINNSYTLNPERISIEAWINPGSSTATWATGNVYFFYGASSAQFFGVAGAATIRFSVYVNGAWTNMDYTPSSISGWHHYVGTYDGANLRLYMDGAAVGTPVALTGVINQFDTGVFYLAQPATANNPSVSIDDVAVYNRALTASEVLGRYGYYTVTAIARDTSGGGVGIQAGDTVTFKFSGPTNGAAISAANIDTALFLSNLHTWKDCSNQITGAGWSTNVYANDTLTITLSATTCVPTVAPLDTVTIGSPIGAQYRAFAKNTKISGLFGDNLPAGKIAYWNFDEQIDATAYDSIGTNHGTLNSSFWRTERIFKGLYFDGNKYVDVPDSNDFNLSSYTIDAWVKVPDSLTTGIRNIISQDDGVNYWRMRLNNNTLELCDSRLTTPCNNTATTINDGEWHHLAVVRDDALNKVLFYIDGVNIYTVSSLVATGTHAITANIQIGRKYNGTEYFYGMIDELVVYGSALSSAQIQTRYRAPVKAAWTSDPYFNPGIQAGNDKVIIRFHGKTNVATVIDSTNINTILPITGKPTGWGTIQGAAWSTYKFTSDTLTVTLGTGATIAGGDTITTNGTYIKDMYLNSISDSITLSGDFAINLPEGAVSYWTLDSTNNDTLKQNNIASNTGTFSTTTYKLGTASLSFSTTNKYAQINNSRSLNPERISIEGWVYGGATWSGDSYFFYSTSSAQLYGTNAARTVNFKVYINGAWQTVSYTPMSISGWHHYAGTYDGTNLKIYMDGVLQATSATTTGVIYQFDTGSFYLGYTTNGSGYYIDDMVIYNRALTATEIYARYGDYSPITAFAKNTSGGGSGIQANDTVTIKFPGPTNGIPINSSNIDAFLTLSGLHSWKDGSGQITVAVWSTNVNENDTLTITLSAATSAPTVAPQDTISIGGAGEIGTKYRAVTWSVKISGTFGDPLPGTPVAHYKMDENTGIIAFDSIGTNDGTLTNSPVWTYPAMFNSGINFSGNTAYMSVPSITLSGNWSIEGWFNYPLPATTTWNSLFGDRRVVVRRADLHLGTHNGTSFVELDTPYVMSGLTSGWHHIAAVGDSTLYGGAGGTKFYIDGVLVGTANYKTTAALTTVGNVTAGSEQFGLIDELAIYSSALADADVASRYLVFFKEIYAKDTTRGGAGIQNGDQVIVRFDGPTGATAITSGNIGAALQLSGGHVWGNITSAVWSTMYKQNDTLTITLDAATATVAMRDTITLGGIITDLYAKTITGSMIIGGDFGTNLPDGAVGYWKFDETSGTAASDSFNDNNGTLTNTPTWAIGRFNNALTFTGGTGTDADYVVVNNASVLNPSRITVEAWVKSGAANWNTNGTIVSKRDAYILYPVLGSGNMMFYIYAGGAWRSVTFTNVGGAVDITQWHHYAGTYDGTNLRIYVDGVLKNTAAYTGTVSTADTGNLFIGMDDGTTNYLNGSIDEVVIYNRALSSAEVQTRYGAWFMSSVADDNSGKGPNIQANDRVIIKFTGETNGPTINATNINTILAVTAKTWLAGNGALGGTGQGVWSQTTYPNDTLTITLSGPATYTDTVPAKPTIVVGDTITLNGTIKDTSGRAIIDSMAITGSFGTTAATIGSAAADDNSGKGPNIQANDRVVITFSSATNAPAINAGNINTILPLSGGHSWLDGGNNIISASWNSPTNTVLIITLSGPATYTDTIPAKPTVVVGDTITINGTLTSPTGMAIVTNAAITGSFGTTAATIGSAAADDNSGKGPNIQANDRVVITFSGATNAPAINAGNINTILPVTGKTWLDGNGAIGSATWNSPTNTVLIITLSGPSNYGDTAPTAPTVVVGDTIAINGTITDSTGKAIISSKVITGTFGTASSVVPSSAVADDNSTWGPNIQANDRVVITFSGATNAPAINAGNINTILPVTGKTWLDGNGAIGSATWNSPTNTILTITLSGPATQPDTTPARPTVAAGDTIIINGTITDSTGGLIIANRAITGSFGTASGTVMSSAIASDDSGTYGINTGDKVVIKFNGQIGATGDVPPTIDATNIDTALSLNNGHSWKDGSGAIGGASWSTTTYANDTLTITLSSTTSAPTIAAGDTITLGGGIIKDKYRIAIISSSAITGDFTIPSGMKAWWKLDASSGTGVSDSIGSYSGTVTNSGGSATTWTTGRFSNGLYLDGSTTAGDYIALTTQYNLTSSWTIEGWFKKPIASVITSQQIHTLVSSNSTSNENQIVISNQTWQIGTSTGSTFYWVPNYTIKNLSSGWHYITAVGSGGSGTAGTTQFYIDGNSVGTAAYKSVSNISYLGNSYSGTRPMSNTVDNIIIYDTALSAAAIKNRYGAWPRSAYANGLAGDYAGITTGDQVVIRFDQGTGGNTIDNTNIATALVLSGGHTWGTIQSAVWSTTAYTNDTLTITLTTTGSPTIAKNDTITLSNNVIKDFVGRPISDTVTLQGSFDLKLPSGAIAFWRFNEGSGTAVSDSFGSNNGTTQTTVWSDGMYGTKGVTIDASTEAVALNSAITMPTEWTIMGWIKTPIIGAGKDNALTHGTEHEHAININMGSINQELGSLSPASDPNGGSVFRGTGYYINNLKNGWHHVAAAGTGGSSIAGTTTFYIDGQPVGAAIGYKAYTDMASIGNNTGAGLHDIGTTIDEISVYNRPLTATEIRQYYGARLKYARAKDTSGLKFGINAGDQVVIRFDGETNAPAITATNIDTVLKLSNGHTWKDGNGVIGSAVWSTTTYTNDTLTITLSTGLLPPTVTNRDTITLDGVTIKDLNRVITDSIDISGDFDGSVAYWDLDDGVGLTATDSVNGNNGTLGGNTLPAWTSGYYQGSAINFNDVNTQYVTVPDSNNFNMTDYTIEAWIKLPASIPGNNYMRIVSQESNTNPANYWSLAINPWGRLVHCDSLSSFTAPVGITVANSTTTSGSATVTTTNSFNTAGVKAGLIVSGTGIDVNTYVVQVNSATQITLSKNATANGVVTLTFTADPQSGGYGMGGLPAGQIPKCETVDTKDLRDDKWHFISVVRDSTGSGNFKFYIDHGNCAPNCTPDKTVAGGAGSVAHNIAGTVEIGRKSGYWDSNSTSHEYFRGVIDNVAIYNYAMTDAQVNLHHFLYPSEAWASDTSGLGAGIQANDSVTILFNGETGATAINSGNIGSALQLPAGKAWGTINSASWSQTYYPNDTLKVTLGSGMNIAIGDTITLGTVILDVHNNPISGSIAITGSFQFNLPIGVIAYWPFDEGINQTVTDQVGSYSGTIYNGTSGTNPAWVAGKFGYALSFPLNTWGYVTLTNNVPLTSSEWTIEAWISTPLPVNADNNNILMQYNNVTQHIRVMPNPTNRELGTYYSGAGGGFYPSGYIGIDSLAAGWHHLVTVGKNGKTYFYIDGVQVGSPANYQSNISIAKIGNGMTQATAEYKRPFGKVDDVVIYKRALSAAEISQRAAR